MATDVVCQMQIDEKTAEWRSEYKSKTYYFCSPLCKQKFDRNPGRFAKSAQTVYHSRRVRIGKKQTVEAPTFSSPVYEDRIKRADET